MGCACLVSCQGAAEPDATGGPCGGDADCASDASCADEPCPGADADADGAGDSVIADLSGLTVSPTPVDFGDVFEAVSTPLTVLNGSGVDIEVKAFSLVGSPGFVLQQSHGAGPAIGRWTASTLDGVTDLAEPIVVQAGASSTSLTARFEPTRSGVAAAQLVLFADVAGARHALEIPLLGNLAGPCSPTRPGKVSFGPKLVGVAHELEVTVGSCREDPAAELVIRELSLDAEGSPAFSLDLGGMPRGAAGPAPVGTSSIGPADAPIVVPPHETATFKVRYAPGAVSPLGADGKHVRELGLIRIGSDTPELDLEMEVSGFGVTVGCPNAVISVAEGEQVLPQTTLHLKGSQSSAVTGAIKRYEWTAQQPAGSQSVLMPNFLAPDPTFEVNVAGEYVFTLNVYDASDEPSCETAEVRVLVVQQDAIRIELEWETPGDRNPADEGPMSGADLDLHFAHPDAHTSIDWDADGVGDPWFDIPHDCYWFNADPNWGSLSPTVHDNPHHDLDSLGGARAETVRLNLPEKGRTYRVGVHCWSSFEFGPSLPTVRIYIHEVLRAEFSGVELVDGDLWEVATVRWPGGEATPITAPNGAPKILPNYPTPFPPE
ncbi:MAG: hypothetical protein H6744_07010 [Deltaproteobacteria bacterium]|nr:hypothetical protein [Deltaproteobacteria bacterium]